MGMMVEMFQLLAADVRDESEAPKGPDVYYRCRLCSSAIPSQPDDNIGCDCGNIFIDIDYFRLVVRDFGAFEVVRRS